MFGRMMVEPLVQVDPGADLQSAVAALVKVTESVEIVRWIDFPASVPNGNESIVSLGEKPMCYRGSIVVSGRKRPLRHLVSCSQELADNTSDGKLLLVSDDQLFIWSSLVCHYGLPATPEWRSWMIS